MRSTGRTSTPGPSAHAARRARRRVGWSPLRRMAAGEEGTGTRRTSPDTSTNVLSTASARRRPSGSARSRRSPSLKALARRAVTPSYLTVPVHPGQAEGTGCGATGPRVGRASRATSSRHRGQMIAPGRSHAAQARGRTRSPAAASALPSPVTPTCAAWRFRRPVAIARGNRGQAPCLRSGCGRTGQIPAVTTPVIGVSFCQRPPARCTT